MVFDNFMRDLVTVGIDAVGVDRYERGEQLSRGVL
jgi:hypothetical protein